MSKFLAAPFVEGYVLVMRTLLVALAAFVAGLALGFVKWNWAGQNLHFAERLGAIEAHASQEPGGVLVIGDSITEYNRFTTLCGKPALNAGVAWARTKDWLPHARKLIAAYKPSAVIIALGTNDEYGEAWKVDYAKLAKLGTIAIGTDNPDKDAYIRSLLPFVQRPSVKVYGKHPNAAGARLWRDNICAKLG